MALNEYPMTTLGFFLPNTQSFQLIMKLMDKKGVELEIKRERKTIYGNFQVESGLKSRKKITINGNLGPLQFLITLLHELAHLYTYNNYGFRVKPHGKEWKSIFSSFLKMGLECNSFPQSIVGAIQSYASNPKASSCLDTELFFAIHEIEKKEGDYDLLGMLDLQEGEIFEDKKGRKFKMISKLRKNYLIKSLKDNHEYTAPPTLEVKLTTDSSA